jgi:predicted DNA-binding transcriptional regulator YafY
MKADMRRALARQPFEQKIQKIGQLLELSAKLKSQRGNNDSTFVARGLRAHKNDTRKIQAAGRQLEIRRDPLIISAIRRKAVLQFSYNGKLRTVEPQTYGLSTTGREVLRAYERPLTNGAKRSGIAKLFDLEKISELRESGEAFREALPTHNPDDSAMVEIFATLPARRN